MKAAKVFKFGTVEVVDVADIQPAAYNPRKVVPARLELVRLSLSKLGWLLPIYATEDGRILSGHQRHHVATEMLGARTVPVVRVGNLGAQQERALNLVFNRMTNDMRAGQSSETLADALAEIDIEGLLARVKDLDMNSTAAMPVLQAQLVSVADVLDANPLWVDEASTGLTDNMRQFGISAMPIVCTPDLQIINGRARAASAGRKGIAQIPVVVIPKTKAKAAGALLNLLSMRYDMQGGLADDFRSNAFKAAPSTRGGLSVNSTYDLVATRSGARRSSRRYFDWNDPEHQARWLKFYGHDVLDWGAGNYVDAGNFETMGARVVAFEPYHGFDRDKARAAAQSWFFDRIGTQDFTTIFLSNVINSVPFEEDRRHIVTLVSSLATAGTLLAATTRSTAELGRDRTDMLMSTKRIDADHERNARVSNLNARPLLQKFHSPEEFAELWRHGFRSVKIGGRQFARHENWSVVRATDPIRPSIQALRAAIEFEFDLPFNDGSRLGLVDEARKVWRARGWKV